MEEKNVVGKVAGGSFVLVFALKAIATVTTFLIGLFIFIINIAFIFTSINYVETTATIVEVHYDQSKEAYVPTYEFVCNGETVRVDGIGNSDRTFYSVGEKTPINYNPKNYRQINEGSKHSLMPWFISIFSLISSFISISAFIKLLKKFSRNKFDMFNTIEEFKKEEGENSHI